MTLLWRLQDLFLRASTWPGSRGWRSMGVLVPKNRHPQGRQWKHWGQPRGQQGFNTTLSYPASRSTQTRLKGCRSRSHGRSARDLGVLFSNLSLRLMVKSPLTCQLPESGASFQHFSCDPPLGWPLESPFPLYSHCLTAGDSGYGGTLSSLSLFTFCFPISQFPFLFLLTLNIGVILGPLWLTPSSLLSGCSYWVRWHLSVSVLCWHVVCVSVPTHGSCSSSFSHHAQRKSTLSMHPAEPPWPCRAVPPEHASSWPDSVLRLRPCSLLRWRFALLHGLLLIL